MCTYKFDNFLAYHVDCDLATSRSLFSYAGTIHSKVVKTHRLFGSGVPRWPHLKVFYHRQPNVVGIGRMLSARCVASVGTAGVLVWRLHTKPDTLTWKVRFSDDDGDVHTDSVSITSDKGEDGMGAPRGSSLWLLSSMVFFSFDFNFFPFY